MRIRNRVLVALRFAWAIRLAAYASRRGNGGRQHRRLETAAACALAARQLAESLVTALRASPQPPRWPALLDALHALSMLPVAVLSTSLRRDAVRSGAVAALLALTSR